MAERRDACRNIVAVIWRWEDNIKVDFRETDCDQMKDEEMDWAFRTHGRDGKCVEPSEFW
jgi:hypothetical protein